jgi:hypothetical protein
LHAVKVERGLHGRCSLVDARLLLPEDLDTLAEYCAGSSGVAIDAPECPSTAPHRNDLNLSPKFRTARCCEVASAQAPGLPAVAWVTPSADAEIPGWMQVGFQVWERLKDLNPMEVYPHACFFQLSGNRMPKSKQRTEGLLERVALLGLRLDLPPGIEVWSHDGLDAAVAGFVATQGRRGAIKVPHECDNWDGSELWVPG